MGMGMPIRFSASAAGFDTPAPGLGEHNDHVYREVLGYSAERVEALRARHVI
jgi:crotonobetainyl-CoA:carnitine CoA-transferase CaiB-like acyl-CoA transferase